MSLLHIFIDVITPVAAVVGLGYLLGPRLQIESRSLSRTAYYLFIPAFVFHMISTTPIPGGEALKMVAFSAAACLGCGLLGYAVARLLRCPSEVAVVFFMAGVFGNVGNYGLAMVRFRLGEAALAPATVYMVAINTLAFTACVVAASWARHGGWGALAKVLKTPGITILPVALLFPLTDTAVPVMLSRIAGLLSDAMIPTMLLVLGLQLREAGRLDLGARVWAACTVRLVGGALLAVPLAGLIGLTGLTRDAGILQASMPAAVLIAIVAGEHRVAPRFATSVVFLSTLASLVTLSLLMAYLPPG